MFGLLPVTPAEPLVVERTLRIESHRFFGTSDGGVMLLGFVVGLCEEQMNFGIARILLDGLLQELRRFGVIACFVGFLRGREVVIAAHNVCCYAAVQQRR